MGLDLPVTLLVLLAAAMHAGWNALVKVERDRLVAFALINGTGTVLGALLVVVAPPLRAEAWAYLAPSLVLQTAYVGVLMLAYRVGDLSQVYPVARGTAPLGVILLSLLLEGRVPPPLEVLGVLAVSLGIVSLAWRPGQLRGLAARWGAAPAPSARPGSGGARAIAYAAGCGLLISGYTVLDSRGVRVGESPMAYGGWLFVFYGLPWVALALARRGWQPARMEARHWMLALGAGSLCFGAYLAVVWALNRGAAAPVSALRETSVIFAALIGTLLLKEPFGARRVTASALVALGVVLIRLG
jgi:drug/metabolite transporter (DMT)-like permease